MKLVVLRLEVLRLVLLLIMVCSRGGLILEKLV